MNKNYFSYDLGGEKRGVKYNLGTLKHIGIITKGEPFDFTRQDDTPDGIYRYVFVLIHAGLLSNADSKDQEPDFTEKDVEKWISDWDLRQSLQVISDFNAAFVLSEEESGDTRKKTA